MPDPTPNTMMHDGNIYHFGWIDDKAAVNAVLATLPNPLFSAAAPHLRGTWTGGSVFFWDAEEQVLGHRLPSFNQGQIGSCVGNGWGRACQDLIILQIALGHREEFHGEGIAPEPIYG